MITRQHFVNKLRELEYHFKKQYKRVSLWKKGTHRVMVPRTDLLSPAWVRWTLKQCGETDEAINKFIGPLKN